MKSIAKAQRPIPVADAAFWDGFDGSGVRACGVGGAPGAEGVRKTSKPGGSEDKSLNYE